MKTLMKQDKKTAKKAKPLSEKQKRFNNLFEKAHTFRSTSTRGTTISGYTNEQVWEVQEDYAYPVFEQRDEENGYRSNVRSPEIIGRIQSMMQKMVKLNLGFVTRARRPEAEKLSKVISILLEETFQKNGFTYRIIDAFQQLLTHGTALMTVDYMVKKRPVKVAKSYDEMSKEEIAQFKKDKKLVYKDVIKVDKRDVVLINRRLETVYIDPDATSVHGDSGNAGYYFLREDVSFDRFKSLYYNRPSYDMEAIKRVKPASSTSVDTYGEDNEFAPEKQDNGDYVRILTMSDYDNDLYMVKANDEFIYEGPLPYDHKKHNLILMRAIKRSSSVYGVGLVDLLLSIVTQIELLQNAVYDHAMLTSNPIMLVDSTQHANFSRYYKEAQPGLMIPVRDVGRTVVPLKQQALSMDIFQAVGSLQRDAVVASQIDPSQLGVVSKNSTATANMINREVVDAFVNYLATTMTESVEEIANQVLALLYQFLTQKDIEEYDLGKNEGKIQPSKVYRIDDVDIDIEWGDKDKYVKDIKVEERTGKVSFLPISEQLFTVAGSDGEEPILLSPTDFDIQLSAESKEVLSESLEIQRMKEDLAQLAPFMVDPNDKAKVAQHPTPWINGPAYLEAYFDKAKKDKGLLISKKEEVEKAQERAEAQNKEMMNMVRSVPQAGEIEEHIKMHLDLKLAVDTRLAELNAEIEKERKASELVQMEAQQMMAMSQGMGQMPNFPEIPQPDTEMLRKQEVLSEISNILSEHISIDSMPAYMATETIGKPPAPTQPQAPMLGGQGGNTIMGGTGNMGGAAPPIPQPEQPIAGGGPGMVGGYMGV